VRITRDQQIYLNDARVTTVKLAGVMQTYRTRHGINSLVLKADEGIPYRLVIQVIDTARLVGITDVALAARRPDEVVK
jgi:biopolymer transport protein ExbD